MKRHGEEEEEEGKRWMEMLLARFKCKHKRKWNQFGSASNRRRCERSHQRQQPTAYTERCCVYWWLCTSICCVYVCACTVHSIHTDLFETMNTSRGIDNRRTHPNNVNLLRSCTHTNAKKTFCQTICIQLVVAICYSHFSSLHSFMFFVRAFCVCVFVVLLRYSLVHSQTHTHTLTRVRSWTNHKQREWNRKDNSSFTFTWPETTLVVLKWCERNTNRF